MTDMIPRDAAIAAISALLSQATHNDPVDAGYRSCVGDALSELRAIPAIDPASIREAALYELAEIARGEGPLDEEAILAMIGEKK